MQLKKYQAKYWNESMCTKNNTVFWLKVNLLVNSQYFIIKRLNNLLETLRNCRDVMHNTFIRQCVPAPVHGSFQFLFYIIMTPVSVNNSRKASPDVFYWIEIWGVGRPF